MTPGCRRGALIVPRCAQETPWPRVERGPIVMQTTILPLDHQGSSPGSPQSMNFSVAATELAVIFTAEDISGVLAVDGTIPMGVFDKLKTAAQTMTGGAAKVSIEYPSQAVYPGEGMNVRVTVMSSGGEVKSKGVFVDLLAEEKVSGSRDIA